MSHQELDRLTIIESVINKKITQKVAAQRLNLTVRHIKRLVKSYRTQGTHGLISKRRGQPSNNKISETVRSQAIHLIRNHYHDFSPTFAHEKLTEDHGLSFSVETLRNWMIDEGIWESKTKRAIKVHQTRTRRSCFGELIQVDGSPHDWFEGRAPKCSLIVFVDDATSALMSLKFTPSETTKAYMQTLEAYLHQYGRPAALYSDKHGIFKVNHPDQEGEITQFNRALKTLDIELICAHSPQAKGRVERANQTLQNRLIKEMRLKGICSIEEANAYLPEFIEKYNKRFAKPPHHPEDAHRPLLQTQSELNLIFSHHHHRILSKNLTIKFKNREYQLKNYGKGYRLRKAKITVCEHFDGQVTLIHEGQQLNHQVITEQMPMIHIEDDKTLNLAVDQIMEKQRKNQAYKPSIDHPWRRSFKQKEQMNIC